MRGKRLLVSYFEGFGIPLVEAMRCGTPVISGNLTSLPEVVGEAGLLVDPFNTKEIAKAIELLDTNIIDLLSPFVVNMDWQGTGASLAVLLDL